MTYEDHIERIRSHFKAALMIDHPGPTVFPREHEAIGPGWRRYVQPHGNGKFGRCPLTVLHEHPIDQS